MNIDELTIKQAKELSSLFGNTNNKPHPFKVGKNYLIRTVTMIDVGKLEAVYDQELVLSSAAWIAETDRWADCLKYGKLKEVEPFPDGEVIVGRGSIIDAVIWTNKLPREQK